MVVDFLKTADFLQEELKAFYWAARRCGDGLELQKAAEQLRFAVNQVKPLTNDPGDHWKDLATEQRWGYLRILSHLGTATHELKRVGGFL